MANPPESPIAYAGGGSRNSSRSSMVKDLKSASMDVLILLIREPNYRDRAIDVLVKKKETFRGMALSLWNSFDTIYILLKEVVDVYKLLTPSKLTSEVSNRVCNVLALLQIVASHEDTRMPFINANMPIYLYPFLNTMEKGKPFEFLRLTSLGVIGGLVKADDPRVIHFLLESEILPFCLRCIDFGTELSKTVATFIISKILMQDEGLRYCCASAMRFYSVAHVLGGMLERLDGSTRPRLLKDIIICYFRFSELSRTREALRRCFPARFGDATLIRILHDDPEAMRYLQQLYHNVFAGNQSRPEKTEEAFERLAIS